MLELKNESERYVCTHKFKKCKSCQKIQWAESGGNGWTALDDKRDGQVEGTRSEGSHTEAYKSLNEEVSQLMMEAK